MALDTVVNFIHNFIIMIDYYLFVFETYFAFVRVTSIDVLHYMLQKMAA